MENPVVSIIIPTYNREKLILDAIDSILNQTFQDFEILVIDDASTDNTEKVIKDLGNEKIRYYKLDRNGGQCIARNYGIKIAKGNYIAFLDSDDRWLPEKLEKQIACFNKGEKDLGCVYAYAYEKDVIEDITVLPNDVYFRGNIHDKFLEGFCPPTPSIFMVKKEALLKVNGFDEKLITFVDLDLWLRVSKEYSFDYIDEPLIIKYEQIGDQYVNNFEKRYNGYKLFFNKWQDEIIREKGAPGLRRMKQFLTATIVFPMLQHPPKNLRRNIFKMMKLLIDIRSTNINEYIKCLLIMAFGTNIISVIKKIKG